MASTAPVHPHQGRPPQRNQVTAWLGRHKIWITLLVLLVVAVGVSVIPYAR